MNLTNKLALVTGGNDGIGKQIALQLKDKGAAVIVIGRDADRLADMAALGFETVAADLSTHAGIETVVAAMADRPIDLLVNNAGKGTDYLIDAPIDLADVDATVFLNLNAPMHLIARLLPGLLDRPEAMIVNVTSGLAIAPYARGPVYCGTKAGLRSFSMALRAQLRGTRVGVLEALPPVVETRMTEGNTHKKMPAPECARQIVAAVEAGKSYAYVGQTALLNTVYGISPALARWVMLRY